ncbi:MAG TPA: hypothetical protein EYP10_10410, partial [Armatimonadetes bacterium]|nr:hypothetical protein [Armatimonadota bacterium]
MAQHKHNWTYWLYNLALHSATPALVAYLIHRLLIERKGHGAVRYWMGDLPMPSALTDGQPRLWIHAVSVGEVMAAHAIVAQLRQLLPDAWILVTTVTDTGQATARRQMHEANAVAFLPLDFPWAMRRALERVQPNVVVLIEGELWPNLIHWAQLSGSRLVLANGRISDATLSRAHAGGKAFYQCLL